MTDVSGVDDKIIARIRKRERRSNPAFQQGVKTGDKINLNDQIGQDKRGRIK